MLVYARTPTPADEEDEWLYYDPPKKKWHKVVLLTVPEAPQRVHIQHLDVDMKGKAEWVPARRCRVPWHLREAYEATNQAWERLENHDPDRPHRLAAEHVVLQLLEESVASPSVTSAALEIFDPTELSQATGITASELLSHPDTIIGDGVTYVPWPVTERVARALCQRHSSEVTDYIAAYEKEAYERAIAAKAAGGAWFDDPEFRSGRWAQRVKRMIQDDDETHRVLRRWVDGDFPGLSEKYQELRYRHVELTVAILPALDELSRIRSKRSDQIANVIRTLIERPMP